MTSKIHSSKIQRLFSLKDENHPNVGKLENTNQSNPLFCNHSLKSAMIINNKTYQENPLLRWVGEILLTSAGQSRKSCRQPKIDQDVLLGQAIHDHEFFSHPHPVSMNYSPPRPHNFIPIPIPTNIFQSHPAIHMQHQFANMVWWHHVGKLMLHMCLPTIWLWSDICQDQAHNEVGIDPLVVVELDCVVFTVQFII